MSVTRGIQELITPEAASYFLVGYLVLAGPVLSLSAPDEPTLVA